MNIEFYNMLPTKEDNKVRFTFSILPNLCISENAIWFYWLFWGVNIEYK